MEHNMKLDSGPFERVKSGVKKTEVRLNDQKRKEIKIGDSIVFSKRPELKEKLKVKVLNRKEINAYPNMDNYYSKEEQEKYGFVVFDIVLS